MLVSNHAQEEGNLVVLQAPLGPLAAQSVPFGAELAMVAEVTHMACWPLSAAGRLVQEHVQQWHATVAP